ncbi:MAG: ferrous iron transport protein A [Magnetococcales bacterium]|nr:ferrous iron transport protein A [Magnetococcales bacterium]
MGKNKATLYDLKPGQSAKINHIHGDKQLQRRLSEMGLVHGANIQVSRVAPLGDPRTYTVYGFQISLRNTEARNIELDVKRKKLA